MLYVIFPVPSLLLASTFMLMQEKYKKAIAALAEMEKRAVMAESMEEGTLHYHSGQNKAQPSLSPRYAIAFLNYRYCAAIAGIDYCVITADT
ncbi:hypothetical protein ES319_D13G176200v1 [Gossypium barbadense]|uniref:Uncharacterized protein n=1 Tax=Gossypium barbadense TaxID=3634 RepID=A0A5J5NMY6_GOSBA|nr:hypothetical protein ES319_D13G176200v1 [Gossypium barbadense]